MVNQVAHCVRSLTAMAPIPTIRRASPVELRLLMCVYYSALVLDYWCTEDVSLYKYVGDYASYARNFYYHDRLAIRQAGLNNVRPRCTVKNIPLQARLRTAATEEMQSLPKSQDTISVNIRSPPETFLQHHS